MKRVTTRSSLKMLAPSFGLALFLAATASAATAFAQDTADCEDGTCVVGDPPTEGLSILDIASDDESGTDESEGRGSDDDVAEGPESEGNGEGDNP